MDEKKENQEKLRKEYDEYIEKNDPKFKMMHGVATTPVEVVDFINKSVESILREEFGTSLKDEGVGILDPFTGTGIFLKRMIENHIPEEDLKGKIDRGEIAGIELNPEAAEMARKNLMNIPIYNLDTFSLDPERESDD